MSTALQTTKPHEIGLHEPHTEAVTTGLITADFMPVFDIVKAIQRRNALTEFTKAIMVADVDYGTPGGIAGKPSLLKPGAEKLITFFGLTPEFEATAETEDWTGENHKGEAFFYYRYKCRLSRNGRLIGEGEGSCNTWESKYRYRWVSEEHAKSNGFVVDSLVRRGGTISEFSFAIDKAETGGKYGKPAAYWEMFKDAIAKHSARKIQRPMGKERKLADAWEIAAYEYRVPNPDVADQVNTCQKMAQKRSLVAAVLVATNASEFFTQDVEDMEIIDLPASAVQVQHHAEEIHPPTDSAPTEVLKPWKTRGEMKTMFREMQEEFAKQKISAAYDATLKQYGVTNPERFADGAAALECYNALWARLQQVSPTHEESVPA